MPALQERNRVYDFPRYEATQNSTSPGVVLVHARANRTDTGAPDATFADPWEQQQFILAQDAYLAWIAQAIYQGSGHCRLTQIGNVVGRGWELSFIRKFLPVWHSICARD